MEVGPLLPGEWHPALALAFRDALHPEERIAKLTTLVEDGDFDPAGIRVLRSAAGLGGVLFCQMLPGANGQILPPACNTDDAAAQDALLRDGIAWLRSRQARFIHLLARSMAKPEQDALMRAGFRAITSIQVLGHALHDLPPLPEMPTGLSLHAFSPAAAPRFAQALTASFEGTLDIPELNGVRTPEEVLAGLQGDGVFRPSTWKLVCVGERTAGLLLLIEKPDIGGWELSYVGLSPAFRGRGIGRWLVRSALHEAARHGARQLYVSVDVRNAVALQLYAQVGFLSIDEHALFLLFFK